MYSVPAGMTYMSASEACIKFDNRSNLVNFVEDGDAMAFNQFVQLIVATVNVSNLPLGTYRSDTGLRHIVDQNVTT